MPFYWKRLCWWKDRGGETVGGGIRIFDRKLVKLIIKQGIKYIWCGGVGGLGQLFLCGGRVTDHWQKI